MHFQRLGFVATSAAWLSVVATVGCSANKSRQDVVAQRGAHVMPFDLEKTTHVFEDLQDGGLQTVIAKDPSDQQQINLIRQHLSFEAERFAQGDFSDPARIHGDDMPGLKELQAGARQMEIRYSAVPQGGQIRYRVGDPSLVEAIHQWFAAQRHDHGRHATSQGSHVHG